MTVLPGVRDELVAAGGGHGLPHRLRRALMIAAVAAVAAVAALLVATPPSGARRVPVALTAGPVAGLGG